MELFNPFSPYVIGTLLTFIDLVQSRKYSPLTHLKASTHVEKHVLWFYTWRTPTCRMPTIGPLWTSWWFALWNSNFTPFWLFNFYKPFFQRKAAYKYGVWDSERSTISPAFLYDRYYGEQITANCRTLHMQMMFCQVINIARERIGSSKKAWGRDRKYLQLVWWIMNTV